ncbi:zingipain-2 [Ricinus communis]|uniref:zingipain-2 n=1 Tax=Ricinus communis TaxID=3988 RepID=UPI00201A3587|nr:zingipain-2 [Ricinus communis]
MALSLQITKLVITLLMILGTWVSQAMPRPLLNAEAIAEKHEQWMARHGRTYHDNAEKERRFQIFKNNLDYIENFNKAFNKTYKLGLNKFSDLSEEEFVTTYNGYEMPTTLPTANTTVKPTFFSNYYNQDEVPESIDWRENGVVTSVKNQGECGCCWAFSAVAAVEGIAGNGASLSAQQLLDCVGDNSGCGGGTMIKAFEYIVQNQGIVSDTDYPYEQTQEMCRSGSNVAARITGYESVIQSEEALKRAVAKQPISVAIDASSGPNFKSYISGVFSAEDCGTHLTHAVTLVGYGTTEDGTKYWLVKNSWGEEWGESGYMRLQREVGAMEGPCGIAMQASYPTLD